MMTTDQLDALHSVLTHLFKQDYENVRDTTLLWEYYDKATSKESKEEQRRPDWHDQADGIEDDDEWYLEDHVEWLYRQGEGGCG